MPQQTINIGAAPDDGTGDTLRVGGDKINDNFTELYAADAALGTAAALDVDPDDTLAADSDSLIPTQQAVKAYVDNEIAGVGGGASTLDDLTDVNAPTPTNGDVLTWDSTPGEWVPAAPTGGGASAIDDLSDVDTTTDAPSVGDVLEWDGTNWVPAAPSGGGGQVYDFPSSSSAFTTSSSGQASKGIVVVPAVNTTLGEIVPYFPSKVNGATYIAMVATLVGSGYQIDTVLSTSSVYTASNTSAEWHPFTVSASLTAGVRYAVIVCRTDGTGTTVLTIGTPSGANLVNFSTTGLSQTAYAIYTAAVPPVSGTAAASSGTNGAFQIALRAG